MGWWAHWLIFSALILGLGKRTDGLINSNCKGSSLDLADDVCQACISPAHGPPPCGQSAFVSERHLHRCISLPDEEGTEECHGGPPGAELAILTSARKRSPELASHLPGDLCLSFFYLKSCCYSRLFPLECYFLSRCLGKCVYLGFCYSLTAERMCLENHTVVACLLQIKGLDYRRWNHQLVLGFWCWNLDDAKSELGDVYGSAACVIRVGIFCVNPAEVWNWTCLSGISAWLFPHVAEITEAYWANSLLASLLLTLLDYFIGAAWVEAVFIVLPGLVTLSPLNFVWPNHLITQ